VSLPNGVSSNYAYDDAGRLTNLTHTAGEQTLAAFQYTYDNLGNRLTANETLAQPSANSGGTRGCSGMGSRAAACWLGHPPRRMAGTCA
jgi:YD repeat-containing protein